ncbi:trehalose-phosphatase [Leifsonia sp. Root112D2]|uniref:trehalose-phosphatase n=1 Tax=Leifsonia sp. Root112D2 TaxID=1736426 RepID=UPI00070077DF|nr:trehalose-phosphatase [Leifsonia sp. Root112D2]KQV07634.1 trehalose phosphatase [Leifsonia sp. Root112D2]
MAGWSAAAAADGGAVPVELADALAGLARADSLLIALDFDGTLAPFVDLPAEARATPQAKAAIRRLRAVPRTTVAYISGRPVASLARVTEAQPAELLVGSHGVELRLDGARTEVELDPEERRLLAALDAELAAIVQENPGVHLERKPAGLGLHTRLIPSADAAAVIAEARAAAEALGTGITARGGKDIVEFAVRGATKGDGVRRLREHVGASAVLFAGDDVTDEDGFLALEPRDVGIKVGDGDTAAGYRVSDPLALAAALDILADLRT